MPKVPCIKKVTSLFLLWNSPEFTDQVDDLSTSTHSFSLRVQRGCPSSLQGQGRAHTLLFEGVDPKVARITSAHIVLTQWRCKGVLEKHSDQADTCPPKTQNCSHLRGKNISISGKQETLLQWSLWKAVLQIYCLSYSNGHIVSN